MIKFRVLFINTKSEQDDIEITEENLQLLKDLYTSNNKSTNDSL